MNAKTGLLAVLMLIVSVGCINLASADDADELVRLRAENARLHAQLDALASACHVKVQEAPAPAATARTAAPSIPPLAPASPLPPAPPVAPAAAAAAAPAAPQYILVPVPPAHSQTGCVGLFGHSEDAPWKHEENWDALRSGDTQADVEKLLGSDHFNLAAKGRLAWQFGKCGANSQASVIFEGDHLLFWTAPNF